MTRWEMLGFALVGLAIAASVVVVGPLLFDQPVIPRTRQHLIGVVKRLAIGFAVVFAVGILWPAAFLPLVGLFTALVVIDCLIVLASPSASWLSGKGDVYVGAGGWPFGLLLVLEVAIRWLPRWVLGYEPAYSLRHRTTHEPVTPSRQQHRPLVGRTGVTATALRPGGIVVIDGQGYEARADVGHIDPEVAVRVVDTSDFGLVVREIGR